MAERRVPITHETINSAQAQSGGDDDLQSSLETSTGLQSQELYALAGQRMRAGMILLDHDQLVLLINKPAAALLAIPGDAVGKKLSGVTQYHETLLPSTEIGERKRFSLAADDGRQRMIQFTSEALDSGKYRLIILWDVTKVVEKEERYSRAQQLRAAGRMATRLNHEIRDPLAVILAGIQSLETSSSISEEDSTSVGLVLEAARSVIRVLNRFVDSSFSKAAGAKLVPAERLLRGAVNDLKSAALNKGVSLEVLKGPDVVDLFVHEQAMSRAVKNLIQNSLDACTRGGSVRVGWRVLDEHEKASTVPGFTGKVVGIFGEDSGRGLPADLTETSIFKPFVTTKASGTGLGLSVAQEIIELQGGAISLTSLPTGGSAFEILLPEGEPLPCWETAGMDVQEDARCGKACDDCEVKKSGTAQLCWAIKGGEHRDQTGLWLQRCLDCTFFASANLSVSFSRRETSRKE